MKNQVYGMISAVNEGDLGLNPDFDAPWMSTLRDIAGWTVGTLFVISGIIFAIGLVTFLVSKAASSRPGQETGIKGLIFGLIGVVGLGSVGAILVWAAGFNPFAA